MGGPGRLAVSRITYDSEISTVTPLAKHPSQNTLTGLQIHLAHHEVSVKPWVFGLFAILQVDASHITVGDLKILVQGRSVMRQRFVLIRSEVLEGPGVREAVVEGNSPVIRVLRQLNSFFGLVDQILNLLLSPSMEQLPRVGELGLLGQPIPDGLGV